MFSTLYRFLDSHILVENYKFYTLALLCFRNEGDFGGTVTLYQKTKRTAILFTATVWLYAISFQYSPQLAWQMGHMTDGKN